MSQEETPRLQRLAEGTRRVYTFKELSNACFFSLQLAQETEAGSFYNLMFSMLGSAFAVEAYLNHLGQDKFGEKEWEKIERSMNPESKLRVLARLIDYNLDFGRRPCQTFADMFKYRNAIAHARTETLTFEEGQEYDPMEGPTVPETKWEQATTLETAERYYEDARELVRQLHEAAGLPEHQLRYSGSSEWSGSPVSEGEQST